MENHPVNPFNSSPSKDKAPLQVRKRVIPIAEELQSSPKIKKPVSFQDLYKNIIEKGAELEVKFEPSDTLLFNHLCQTLASFPFPGTSFQENAAFVAQIHMDPYITGSTFEGAYSHICSQGYINLLDLLIATPKLQKAHPKLNHLRQLLVQYYRWVTSLNKCATPESIRLWANDRMKEIWAMTSGQEVLIPGGWITHEIFHHLVKSDDTYIQFNYNSGAGGEVYHPKKQESRKEKAPSFTGNGPLHAEDLFFSKDLATAKPLYIQAIAQARRPVNVREEFTSQDIYERVLQPVAARIFTSDKPFRTKIRSGVCVTRAFNALLSRSLGPLFKEIKYHIKFITLVAFFVKMKPRLEENHFEAAQSRTILKESAAKFCRMVSKLLKGNILSPDEAQSAYAAAQSITTEVKQAEENIRKARQSQKLTLTMVTSAPKPFNMVPVLNIDPPNPLAFRVNLKPFATEPFPVSTSTPPHPLNFNQALALICKTINRQLTDLTIPFTQNYAAYYVSAIQSFFEALPIPSAQPSPTDYWSQVPENQLATTLWALNELMDIYGTLTISQMYPDKTNYMAAYSKFELPAQINLFLSFAAITHALAIRYDNVWDNTELRSKLRPKLANHGIWHPEFGNAAEVNGAYYFDDRGLTYYKYSEYKRRIELDNYFITFNKRLNTPDSLQPQQLFNYRNYLKTPLSSIELWNMYPDYQYYKELLVFYPSLSQLLTASRRIDPSKYTCPSYQLFPIELMLDTNVVATFPDGMGFMSKKSINSPLCSIGAIHLSTIAKAYSLLLLTQEGTFTEFNMLYQQCPISILPMDEKNISIFGYGMMLVHTGKSRNLVPASITMESVEKYKSFITTANKRIIKVGNDQSETQMQAEGQKQHAAIGLDTSLLYRSSSEPSLQPYQILYHFLNRIHELSDPLKQTELEASLFRHILFVFPNEHGTFHPTFEIIKEPAFIKLASKFIVAGINHFYHQTSSKDIPTTLFFLKIGNLLRYAYKNHNKTPLAFFSEELQVINQICAETVKKDNLKGAAHLYRLLCLLAQPSSDEGICSIVASWCIYKNYPLPNSLTHPWIEHEISTYIHTFMSSIHKILSTTKKLPDAFKVVLDSFDIIPSDPNGYWKFEKQCVTYFEGQQRICMVHPPSGNFLHYIKNMHEIKNSVWKIPAFEKILQKQAYPLNFQNFDFYFTHPVFGPMRFVSKEVFNRKFSLQTQFNGEWFEYIEPSRLLQLPFPKGLWFHHALWKPLNVHLPKIITSLRSSLPLWMLKNDGTQTYNPAHPTKLSSQFYLDNDNPLRIYLEQFEHPELILVEQDQTDKIARISFVRYTSLQGEPLQFEANHKGELVWTQNKQYALSLTKPLGVVGSLNEYLYLEPLENGPPKVLVPQARITHISSTHDLNPEPILDIHDNFDFHRAVYSSTPPTMGFIEYDIRESKLHSSSSENQFYLLHLNLIQRDYEEAFITISRLGRLTNLSPNSLMTIHNILALHTVNHDTSPDAVAIKMRLVVILLEGFLRNQIVIKPDHVLNLKILYTNYLDNLNNIQSHFLLSPYDEKYIIENFAFWTPCSLFTNRRKELLGETESIEYLITPPKHPLSYNYSFGNVPKPLSPEQFQMYVKYLKWTKHELDQVDNLFDPAEFIKFFYYWYATAVDGTPLQRKELQFRLSLLSKRAPGRDVNDFIFAGLEYLRAAVNKPDLFPKISLATLADPNLFNWFYNTHNLQAWFNAVHQAYRVFLIQAPTIFPPLPDITEITQITPSEDVEMALLPYSLSPIEIPSEYHYEALQSLFKIAPRTDFTSPKTFSLVPADLSPEELPYVEVIKRELARFQTEYEKGREYNLSAPQYLLNDDASLKELENGLNSRLNNFRTHFAKIEKTIQNYANTIPSNRPAMYAELLKRTGGHSKSIDLKRLIGCLLTGDWAILEKKNPNLLATHLKSIQQLTLTAVWIGTQIQKMERCLSALADLEMDKDSALQKIGEELFAELSYQPHENPTYLVQEYLGNLRIFTFQSKFLKAMEAKTNDNLQTGVFKLRSNGGKTTVIASQEMFRAAEKNRLSLYLAHPSQYESIKEQFKNNQMEYAGQEVDAIDYAWNELNETTIVTIDKILADALTRKRVVLMKSDFPHLLYLYWIQSMEQYLTIESMGIAKPEEIIKLQNHIMKQYGIQQAFKSKTNALGDEPDLNLDIMHESNLQSGELLKPPTEWIDITLEAYRLLYIHPSAAPLVRLQEGLQFALPRNEFKSIILPVLAKHIGDIFFSRLVPQIYHNSLHRYLQNKINSRPLSNPQNDEELKDAQFLTWMETTYKKECPLKENKTLSDHIAVARFIINQIIPLTLQKKTNRKYGRSDENPEKVRPFKGASAQSQEDFANVLSEIAANVQVAATNPLPEDLVENFLSNKLEIAYTIANISHSSIDATEIGKWIGQVVGIPASKLTMDNLREPLNIINADIHKKFQIVQEISKNNILYQTSIISSDPILQARRFLSFRVFSGTAWNYKLYERSLARNFYDDSGSEGRVADVLIRKAEQNPRAVHFIESADLLGALKELKSTHPNFRAISGAIDVGGFFADKKPSQAAAEVSQFYRNNQTFKGVFTFAAQGSKIQQDTPTIHRGNNEKVIPLSHTDASHIKAAGFKPSDLFYFFPEMQIIGSNVAQSSEGLNMLTIDPKTPCFEILQGALRSRKIFEKQQVEYLVQTHAKSQFNWKGNPAFAILLKSVVNQAIKLSESSPNFFIKALQSEKTVLATNAILCQEPIFVKIIAQFKATQEAFKKSTLIKPYLMLGAVEREQNPQDLYRRIAAEEIARWGSLFPNLETNLKDILNDARESPYTPEKIEDSNALSLGVGQQVFTQTQVQAHLNLNTEMRKELETYSSLPSGLHLDETPWTYEDADNYSKGLLPTIIINTLPGHLAHFANLYPMPYHLIFDQRITATHNFLFTYSAPLPVFHNAQKPAFQILVHQSSQGWKYLLLSLKESCVFKSWLLQNIIPENSKMMLIMPDGHPIGREPIIPPPHDELMRMLIQINAFNGNTLFLEHHQLETQKWLQEGFTELKLRFLLLKTHNQPFYRDILLNGSLKDLVRKVIGT